MTENSTEKSDIRFTGYHNFSPNYHISTKMGDGYEPGADWIEWGSGTSGWLYKYQMQGLRSRIYGLEFDFQYELLLLLNQMLKITLCLKIKKVLISKLKENRENNINSGCRKFRIFRRHN